VKLLGVSVCAKAVGAKKEIAATSVITRIETSLQIPL
jgi:hypothetical protein